MGLNLTQKTAIRRKIDREWRWALTPAEQSALTFVFTMTIEWDKAETRLTLEDFVSGRGKIGGTGMSRMTVRRALDGLAAKGVIDRHGLNAAGYVYGINLDWRPPEPGLLTN
jgi:hypothetical protein